ncbi:MAG: CPBP family intramembrane metalloprotease [Gemmatimonadales bacterium]|nr:MAG: CPBP family intramembrane metalloprotease [Gemmatimonadales bacterium]
MTGPDPEAPGPDTPDSEAVAAIVGRRLRWGAALALGLTLALAFGTELPLLEAMALPVFLVLFPTLAVAQTPLLPLVRFERASAYLSSGFTILIMGALAMGLVALGPGAEAAGIAWMGMGEFLGWTAALTLGALVLSLAFRPLEARAWRRSEGGPEGGTLDDGLIDALLPRTPEERRLFGGLSLAAGWGEEMAYRGYVPAALVLAGVPPWWAFGIAALAFGLLHAYQGPVGVVRTALLGFLLGASLILTGSIFPAMAAHALVDLVLGLVLGPWLLSRSSDPSSP